LLTAQFGRCFGGAFPCSLSSSIIAGYTSLHATLFLPFTSPQTWQRKKEQTKRQTKTCYTINNNIVIPHILDRKSFLSSIFGDTQATTLRQSIYGQQNSWQSSPTLSTVAIYARSLSLTWM